MTTKKTKKNEVKPNVTTTVSQNDVYVTLEQTGSSISIKTSSLSEIKDLNDLYRFQNLLDQAIDTFTCLNENEDECFCTCCEC